MLLQGGREIVCGWGGSFFNDFFFQLFDQVLPLLEFLLLLSRDLLERERLVSGFIIQDKHSMTHTLKTGRFRPRLYFHWFNMSTCKL